MVRLGWYYCTKFITVTYYMLQRCILLFTLPLLATGCALLPEPHRIDITQGKVIKASAVEQLKPGMTKDQVQFLMGSPALQDIFNPDRWDYIHYVDKQGESLVNQRIALFFDGDQLKSASSEDFSVAHINQATLAANTAPAKESPPPAQTSVEATAVSSNATQQAEQEPSPEDQVTAAIEAWKTAWSQQDVSTYLGSYTQGYHTDKRSNKAWQAYRTRSLSKPKFIKIDIENLNISMLDDNTARAIFVQSYESNSYRDKVEKQLTLSKSSGEWKITYEKTLKKL